MAVVILIFNYSWDELQADKYNENLDNIYVVKNNNRSHVPYEMEPLLSEQIAGIKHISLVESNMRHNFSLQYENEEALQSDIIFTNNEFLKIFSFQLVQGRLEDALLDPNSILLTQSEAQKLFGTHDVLGKTLSLKGNPAFLGESEVEVKAVIKDLPKNSNLQFKGAVSFSTAQKMRFWIDQCNWGCSNVQNYVTLEDGMDPLVLAEQMNKQLIEFVPEKVKCDFSFFPYSEVYFSDIRDDFKHGNLNMIITMGSIALLILVIATINFINLSMAGISKRLTEVGVKKIVGIRSFTLVSQLIGESILFSFFSILLGVAMARILTPALNNLSVIVLPAIPIQSILFWAVIVVASILVGILAGIIPALALNKFRPISLVTHRISKVNGGFNLKRILIVIQYGIAIVLMVCTFTITRQLSLVRNSDLGFQTENIINVQLNPDTNTQILKDKLLALPGVENVSFSRWYPGNIQENWSMDLVAKGEEREVKFACENADAAYIDIMELEMVQGRNFSTDLSSDIRAAILNEAAVKEWELEKPMEAYFSKNGKVLKIVGVVKDFNFQSLHNTITPMVIFNEKEQVYTANIKLSAVDITALRSTLEQIKLSWKEVSSGFPFEFKFIDEEVENLYNTEIIYGKIFRSGSLFAILISCLGLLGLVLSTTEHRKKEIGIRKVNGAKIGEILLLLNRDFLIYVLMAFVIACPMAWYVMNKWLENFAYKTNVSWWIFALAGALALGIAFLTVSWQSWKAATRNPVESLRYE